MRPLEPVASVEITAVSVSRGDVIHVGGQPLRVVDMVTLPTRAKRLRFHTGETLTMHSRTRLLAVRDFRRCD